VARIAFNRPNVRNAFRPKTTAELYQAFMMLKKIPQLVLYCSLLKGHQPKRVYSFCSGGDQNARGHQGYVGDDGQHRLNILEVRLICFMPKVVIAVVPGWVVVVIAYMLYVI
jgi:naphthoate synthase